LPEGAIQALSVSGEAFTNDLFLGTYIPYFLAFQAAHA